MQNQPSLSEKLSLVIEYMLLGHDLQADGRHFVLACDGERYQLGYRMNAWVLEAEPEKQHVETIVHIGMSFNHFFSIVQDLTDGDIGRIRQIVAESEEIL